MDMVLILNLLIKRVFGSRFAHALFGRQDNRRATVVRLPGSVGRLLGLTKPSGWRSALGQAQES